MHAELSTLESGKRLISRQCPTQMTIETKTITTTTRLDFQMIREQNGLPHVHGKRAITIQTTTIQTTTFPHAAPVEPSSGSSRCRVTSLAEQIQESICERVIKLRSLLQELSPQAGARE